MAARNSGRNSSAVAVGVLVVFSTSSTSSMIPNEEALAIKAMKMPVTGMVVTAARTGISGFFSRYSVTTSVTMSATPASSGTSDTGSSARVASSSPAPKKAAPQPTTANTMATRSHGALRSWGGSSS